MTETQRKVFIHKVGTGNYVLDSRYFPLLISGWYGDASKDLVDHFYDLRNQVAARAKQDGIKCIQITDISQMAVPTASVRKHIADSTLQADVGNGSMHEYVVVIPSAIMRGVATAVNWITGDKGTPTHNVGSIEAAIAHATKSFAALGVSFPSPPAGYTIPSAPPG